MAEVDHDPEAAAGDAMQALTEAMIRVVQTQPDELGQEKGAVAALAFAAIPVCAKHLALAMRATCSIEYLDNIAAPMRNSLTEHGGPGVSVYP